MEPGAQILGPKSGLKGDIPDFDGGSSVLLVVVDFR
jgi:hypothetical protein